MRQGHEVIYHVTAVRKARKKEKKTLGNIARNSLPYMTRNDIMSEKVNGGVTKPK